MSKSLNRNGLFVKSITAFHHHRHFATTAATSHHHSHSFTTFCFVSRKSFCVMLKIEKCSFIFPLIITAYDVLLFFCFSPFFFHTQTFMKIEQFIWYQKKASAGAYGFHQNICRRMLAKNYGMPTKECNVCNAHTVKTLKKDHPDRALYICHEPRKCLLTRFFVT